MNETSSKHYKIFNYISLISSCVYGFHFYFLLNNKFPIHNNYYSDSVEHSYMKELVHNLCMLMKMRSTKKYSNLEMRLKWDGMEHTLRYLYSGTTGASVASLPLQTKSGVNFNDADHFMILEQNKFIINAFSFIFVFLI